MATSPLDAEVFGQLNQKQKALLDTVDNLRSQGVGDLVDLPQIIVVGDQSSGKSSVLEAISRVRFPVKDGICTRFPTELVVRRSPREEVMVRIQESSSSAAKTTPAFNERQFNSDALPDLIERARDAMTIRDDATGFSEDVLHIEVSGPDLPALTLVDLPGIYRTATGEQSKEGKKVVERLVNKYMAQKRSIILTVVNASYDFTNQSILEDAERHDPKWERTMGIITNPDRLVSSSMEGRYKRLVLNEEPLHKFKHGWHVLRNRGPEENDEQGQGVSRTSDKERDEAEKDFFSSGIWNDVPKEVKGIDELRKKLSTVLTQHIQQSMPQVIEKIQEQLEARQQEETRLGEARTTPRELRSYLYKIAEKFRDLTRLATTGNYDDLAFLGDARRLRAIVRNLNHAFDEVISSKGARRKIVWEDGSVKRHVEDSSTGDTASPTLALYMGLYDVLVPESISWAELEEELEVRASLNQSTHFPGSPNDRLALGYFRDQSSRWRRIADKHVDLVVQAAEQFVLLALNHAAADNAATREALLRECVDPFFEQRRARLKEKLDELLRHYERGEALTLENEFIRALAARDKQRAARHIEDILAAEPLSFVADAHKDKLPRSTVDHVVSTALENRTGRLGLEKVVYIATVYYEMSLRTFTENVIILAVENCLVSELSSVLTPSMVLEMDEEKLSALAAESPADGRRRTEVKRDIRVLQDGLAICKEHRPPRESAALASSLPLRAAPAGTNGTPTWEKPNSAPAASAGASWFPRQSGPTGKADSSASKQALGESVIAKAAAAKPNIARSGSGRLFPSSFKLSSEKPGDDTPVSGASPSGSALSGSTTSAAAGNGDAGNQPAATSQTATAVFGSGFGSSGSSSSSGLFGNAGFGSFGTAGSSGSGSATSGLFGGGTGGGNAGSTTGGLFGSGGVGKNTGGLFSSTGGSGAGGSGGHLSGKGGFGSFGTPGAGSFTGTTAGVFSRGSAGNTTGGLFGNTGGGAAGNATRGGFGSGGSFGSGGGFGNGGGFGSGGSFGNGGGGGFRSTTGGLFGSQVRPPDGGTRTAPYKQYIEEEFSTGKMNCFNHICFQDAYRQHSAEELKLSDYKLAAPANGRSGF